MRTKILTLLSIAMASFIMSNAQGSPDVTAYGAIVNPAPIVDSTQDVWVAFTASNVGNPTIPFNQAILNGAVKITVSLTGLKPNLNFDPNNDIKFTSPGDTVNNSGVEFIVTYFPSTVTFVFTLNSEWPNIVTVGAINFTISNLHADTVSTSSNPLSGLNVNVNAIGAYNASTNNDITNSYTYATHSGVPLPLKLTSFDAAAITCGQVGLTWQMEDEQLSHYELEYGNNGKDFKTIKVVKVSDSKSGGQYQTTVNQTEPIGFYRLKAIDLDNSSFYSKIREIDFSCLKNDLSIYPNPATKTLSISSLEGDESIRVYSTTGRLILSKQAQFKGINNIDISSLTPGMYQLSVVGKDNSYNQMFKFIKGE